ncbi:hypothetical protein PPROV_000638700 [Pycnococcus provasolii]|uniref:Mitochondrial carrier protein n=1 Tax=Pycnococcus provasolii TaxID=41880 RepID=A0A830HM02_9CHLO|nr:hypothetical protein PPROV_000638700 [Pycnococcus provasolii]
MAPPVPSSSLVGSSLSSSSFYASSAIAGASAGIAEHVAMFPLDTIKTRMQAGSSLSQSGSQGGSLGGGERRGGPPPGTGNGIKATPAAAPVMPLGGLPPSTKQQPTCTSSLASTVPLSNRGTNLGGVCPKVTQQAVTRNNMAAAFAKGKHGGSIMSLYRGVVPVAAAAGPVHAIYFVTYEGAKDKLIGREGDPAQAPLRVALAGASATLAADFTMNPVDVVKQRMQLCDSPYKSAFECLRCVVRTEGIGALWRSYPLTAATNVPFTCVYFTAYETAKAFLGGGDDGPVEQCVAGGVAGGLAAAATTPLDVVKTRMQTFAEEVPKPSLAISATTSSSISTTSTSASASPPSLSSSAALRLILREDGARGLLRGLMPRVLFHVPAAAISWTTYETCKSAMEGSP